MRPFTDAEIRASFLNTSKRERSAILVPPALADSDWASLEFVGWRDPKQPLVGYVVVDLDDDPVGLLLRQTETRPIGRAQCAWCADVQLPNDVVMFSTKRAGDAGRRGDTVGTLVCEQFECNVNARRRPTSAYLGFDVEAARQRRIEMLRENVEAFARGIRDGV
jgi:hypothetical protein